MQWIVNIDVRKWMNQCCYRFNNAMNSSIQCLRFLCLIWQKIDHIRNRCITSFLFTVVQTSNAYQETELILFETSLLAIVKIVAFKTISKYVVIKQKETQINKIVKYSNILQLSSSRFHINLKLFWNVIMIMRKTLYNNWRSHCWIMWITIFILANDKLKIIAELWREVRCTQINK